MPTYVLSPNMSLPVPIVSVAPGPDYAQDVNNCLAILDQHTHAFGSGIQITPDGLNINNDLTFQDNNITFLKTIQFSSQTTTIPAVTPYIDCLYVSGVDLYYNDGANNIVRITQSGGVAGSPGSIANLTSPASASYVAGDQTFVWESGANTAANMDFGAAIFRNITPGSNGVTISPPPALAADYGIQLFTALPTGPSFVTIDSAGNLAATIPTAQGITLSNLAPSNIFVTASCGGFSSGSGSFVPVTNLSQAITTSGKPVTISFQPDGTNPSQIGYIFTSSIPEVQFQISRNGTPIATMGFEGSNGTGENTFPPAVLNFTDIVSAGTYTYSLSAAVIGGSTNVIAQYVVMVVREF